MFVFTYYIQINFAMDELDRKALIKTHCSLVTGIINPIKFSYLLREKGFLNEYSVQSISAQPTQLQRASKLMSIVPRQGPSVFTVFVDLLQIEYPELADLVLYNKGVLIKVSDSYIPEVSYIN
jgi:hypothetical protein